MTDRLEVRCEECGLLDVVEPADTPAEMGLRTYAEWLARDHERDCRAAADIGSVPDVEAETTKYSTGGALDD